MMNSDTTSKAFNLALNAVGNRLSHLLNELSLEQALVAYAEFATIIPYLHRGDVLIVYNTSKTIHFKTHPTTGPICPRSES